MSSLTRAGDKPPGTENVELMRWVREPARGTAWEVTPVERCYHEPRCSPEPAPDTTLRLADVLGLAVLNALHTYMQLAKMPPSGWQHNQPLEDAWLEVVRAYRVWLAWKEGRVRE